MSRMAARVASPSCESNDTTPLSTAIGQTMLWTPAKQHCITFPGLLSLVQVKQPCSHLKLAPTAFASVAVLCCCEKQALWPPKVAPPGQPHVRFANIACPFPTPHSFTRLFLDTMHPSYCVVESNRRLAAYGRQPKRSKFSKVQVRLHRPITHELACMYTFHDPSHYA